MPTPNSLILCILDGWGIAPPSPGNAITSAQPETYLYLSHHCPFTNLEASGIAVGLPDGHDGNSETGHLNIGAGRIVYQDLTRINMSIADGSFFTNPALLKTINHVKKNHSSLHLLGLIGASGVHAFNDHLFALLLLASRHQISPVYLHLITDGRDSPPQNALNQIEAVEKKINHFQTGQISSLSGRYYALDRDQHLDRTRQTFDCLLNNNCPNFTTASNAINHSYTQGITDEFIKPVSIGPRPETSRLKPNDALIFYNFRIDRPRQLTKMILDHCPPNFLLTTMTNYHKNFSIPAVFSNIQIKNTLSQIISKQNLSQLHASESEKERFVTYYFNGQVEEPFPNEDRLIISSPRVATYDLKPEMSSKELTAAFSDRWLSKKYQFAVLNIACPDMVGHTGNLEKTIAAIKATDTVLHQLKNLAQQTNSCLLITGDHGNAEELINLTTGEIDTEHSAFPVPLILFLPDSTKNIQLNTGVLADIAPTILHLLNLPQPSAMTGRNLIIS